MLKVFYRPEMSVDSDQGFSPSARKPRLAVEDFKTNGIPISIESFAPATLNDFSLAHEREWISKVLNCELPNGFGNVDPDIAASLPYTAGALIAASLEAAKNKSITIAPVSGHHHAGWNFNGKFCSSNAIISAARRVHDSGLAKRVLILDLDQHDSDGCRHIIEKLKLSWLSLYSFGADDIRQKNAEDWIQKIPKIIREHRPNFVIAQLSADVFENDPLSSSLLTEAQIRNRDRQVFATCKTLDIGTCVTLAGGYTNPFSEVLRIHTNSVREALRFI